MAVIRKFYSREFGQGESDSFALARDVVTDQVFVLHGKTRFDGTTIAYDEARLTLAEFLRHKGSAQAELMDLIGTLVVEE